MLMSDLPTTDLVKVLVFGEPGSGKTVFACGFPGPILLLDFDNKASSAARFYAKDTERLKQINVENMSATFTEDPIAAFSKLVSKLAEEQKTGKYTYKTLVLDSITTFSMACLNHIIKTNPGINRTKSTQGTQPSQQDYGILSREFQRIIPGLLTLDMNIVMTGHISVEKDDLTGELSRGVLMDGKFGAKLPIFFEEVYRAHVEEAPGGARKYLAQTQPNQKYGKIRSQIPGLPAVVPLAYAELGRKR